MSPRPPSSAVDAADEEVLIMTQLYLCEEPYWSKYDAAATDHYSTNGNISINVISDGEKDTESLFTTSKFCCQNFGYTVFFKDNFKNITFLRTYIQKI